MATIAGAPLTADTRACPECGGEAVISLPRYSTSEWHVVACAACGFVYLHNPPPYAALTEEFAWEKSAPAERERRKEARPVVMWVDDKTRWRLALFRRSRADLYRRLFRPGRVLDVGCAGFVAPPEPFIPYGIEISRTLYERVAPLMAARGGRAVLGPVAEAIGEFADGFFSGVILSSVIEHEAQPKRLLAETVRVLESDGSAYIRVPNFGSINRVINGGGWCGFRHPDHVNYFTVTSLKRMARDCGLTVRLLHPTRLLLDDNINAVLVKDAA